MSYVFFSSCGSTDCAVMVQISSRTASTILASTRMRLLPESLWTGLSPGERPAPGLRLSTLGGKCWMLAFSDMVSTVVYLDFDPRGRGGGK